MHSSSIFRLFARVALVDVKTWQQNLHVNLNLRDTQAGLDENKQVRQNSAIRSRRAVS
ncbi:hypothetical protein [Hymenobacter sp. PAMC 26628]|uniref:hypothetical protein n=1 Tax=Hymenobacter sp. PAMC 26628 TaxID=1484118 RepID=UPI000A8CCDAD|nr:hypothetical protein [Hymenobacter sp. PAMC 26628]